jgi:hypothetical protein
VGEYVEKYEWKWKTIVPLCIRTLEDLEDTPEEKSNESGIAAAC